MWSGIVVRFQFRWRKNDLIPLLLGATGAAFKPSTPQAGGPHGQTSNLQPTDFRRFWADNRSTCVFMAYQIQISIFLFFSNILLIKFRIFVKNYFHIYV